MDLRFFDTGSCFEEPNFRRLGRAFTALASALHCAKLRYWCLLRGFVLERRISGSGSELPAVIRLVLGGLRPHGAMLKRRLVLVVS